MAAVNEFGRWLNILLGPEPWCIDDVVFEDGTLEISGWALAPEGRHSDITFTWDNKEFDSVEYPLPRPDIARIFWYKPTAEQAAFRCRTFVDENLKDGYVTLRCVSRKTHLPLRADCNWYFPFRDHAPPLPEPERRKRVAGNASAGIFLLEGYTTFKKLEDALHRSLNITFSEMSNILDWGSGCGRVTRYFHALPNVNLTGIDIDADNVNWCREHLWFADFQHVPLHPPTDLPLSSFDLVMGISVLTHLKEEDQIEWLYELNRVTKPGGILLLTVLGEATVCRSGWDIPLMEQWYREGIIAMHGNEDLKGYIEDDDYYGSTYMLPGYTQRSWSRFFDVVEIMPGYIGNQQDLVILRKRG